MQLLLPQTERRIEVEVRFHMHSETETLTVEKSHMDICLQNIDRPDCLGSLFSRWINVCLVFNLLG